MDTVFEICAQLVEDLGRLPQGNANFTGLAHWAFPYEIPTPSLLEFICV